MPLKLTPLKNVGVEVSGFDTNQAINQDLEVELRALWDNWRCMHYAMGTRPGVRRVINRTTIEGDVGLGRVLISE